MGRVMATPPAIKNKPPVAAHQRPRSSEATGGLLSKNSFSSPVSVGIEDIGMNLVKTARIQIYFRFCEDLMFQPLSVALLKQGGCLPNPRRLN